MESVCSICSSTATPFATQDPEAFNAHMRAHTPAPPPEVPTEEETREVAAADLAETVAGLGEEFVATRVEIGKVWAETAKQDALEAVSEALLALTERVRALEQLASAVKVGAAAATEEAMGG